MYTTVRTVGLFHPCFWDCLCWLCCVPVPIIPHWLDYRGRNGIYAFLIDFCPRVHQILLCMHIPVSTPNDYNWKYLTSFSWTVYTYLPCILSLPLQTARKYFQFRDFYCFTSSGMASKLHLIIRAFWVALKMKQEYESQWETTFCLQKCKPLSLF